MNNKISGTAAIPVFIISFNRGHFVRNLIDSMSHLENNFDFIVHDNGSDDIETLKILDDLVKSQKAQVKSGPKIFDADELNNVNETVVEYFDQSQSSAQNYIVTDCDIDMSGTKTNAIDISCGLLNTFEVVECVGPMLTIEDIPTDYPLYNHVMNRP